MNVHEKLNYLEMAACDLPATKAFFQKVFDWTFQDYGPEYTSFSNEGLDGGFYQAELSSRAERGGALLVFYSDRLEETLEKVRAASGEISQEIFSFPGGRRFHFIEPSGNEFAVWGEDVESCELDQEDKGSNRPSQEQPREEAHDLHSYDHDPGLGETPRGTGRSCEKGDQQPEEGD